MKNYLVKLTLAFILSQMMPVTFILTLQDPNYIDAYVAGITFDTICAAALFIVYAIMFFDEWSSYLWIRMTKANVKRILIYTALVIVALQIIPGILYVIAQANLNIHTTCKGAYGFGWLTNLFIVLMMGTVYFNDKISVGPDLYS